MKEIVLKGKRKEIIKSIIISVIFTLSGILMFYRTKSGYRVFGLTVACICGWFTFYLIWSLVTKRDRIIINSEGIIDTRLLARYPFIAWKDIIDIKTWEHEVKRYGRGYGFHTAIFLKVSETYLSNMNEKVQLKYRKQGRIGIGISYIDYLYRRDELLEVLQQFYVEYS